jgi:sRNA-binding carbon storage regulator CsrA
MSALHEMTRSELTCGETESLGIGDGVEITVLEINGDDVVLRIAGVDESKVVIVGGLATN